MDTPETSRMRELAGLRDWKDSAMQVERTWNEQEVGKLLGVRLGHAIRPEIEPAIRRMQSELAGLRGVMERILDNDGGRVTYDAVELRKARDRAEAFLKGQALPPAGAGVEQDLQSAPGGA